MTVGKVINEYKTWGNKFIDNLSRDLKIAFPNSTGYSVRNLKYMAKFAEEYPDAEFVQTVSAQIPWSHNVLIMEKTTKPRGKPQGNPLEFFNFQFSIFHFQLALRRLRHWQLRRIEYDLTLRVMN